MTERRYYKRRLLLLAPNSFAPLFSSGSIRNVKYIKYLSRMGWQCTVITNPVYSGTARDDSLLNDLPSDVEVIPVEVSLFKAKAGLNRMIGKNDSESGISGKKQLARRIKKIIFGLIRHVLLVPDDFILWSFKVSSVITKKTGDSGWDCIISSGPPFSGHIAGYFVSRKLKIPWVADYRDQWSGHTVFGAKGAYRRIWESILERTVIRAASGITCATEPISKLLRARFPVNAGKVFTVSNGYDPEDYTGLVPGDKTDKMKMVYAGSLGGLLDPGIFFKALTRFAETDPEAVHNMQIYFAGLLLEDSEHYFTNPVLKPIVHHVGLLPHRDAVTLMQDADILLLLVYPQAGGDTIMCGKLYEYIGTGNPVLALVPDGIARETIRKDKLGICCYPDDIDSVTDAIRELYTLWQQDQLDSALERSQVYSRAYQVGKMNQVLTSGLR